MMTNRLSTADPGNQVDRRSLSRVSLTLAFVGLLGIGLTQTGCRSDGCSTCGFGSKLTNGVQSLSGKVFHHKDKGGCSTCGTLGAAEEGVIIDSGVPIVTPGITAVPAPVITPAPTVDPAPSQLEPIPGPAGAAGAVNSSSSRTGAGTNRSAYEATTRKNNLLAAKRGGDLSRAYDTASPARAAYVPEEPDVFDHLPPVDLPTDLSRKVAPLDPPADQPQPPASAGGEGDLALPGAAPPAPSVNNSQPRTSSAESPSAGDRVVAGAARSRSGSVRTAPGMVRSASVAPSVAGGSLPAADGLAWLQEKGYRTLVDLRPRSEVATGFPDQVTDHGMLYVALPFPVSPINLTRLARFNDLMSQIDQRPIYFCDDDGRRAGLIWYLRLRSKDREETNLARSKAEDIGLQATDIPEAERFLKLNFAWIDQAIPSLEIPVPRLVSAVPSLAPAATPVRPQPDLARIASPPAEAPSSTDSPVDRNPSWKPVAALVLSGLGVPLAYWSGSSLLQKRTPRRASLTAKGPGPRKSLPSSGV